MKHLGMVTAALAGLLLVAPMAEANGAPPMAEAAATCGVCGTTAPSEGINWSRSLEAANTKDCQRICGRFINLCRSLTKLQAKCTGRTNRATASYVKKVCKKEGAGAKECRRPASRLMSGRDSGGWSATRRLYCYPTLRDAPCALPAPSKTIAPSGRTTKQSSLRPLPWGSGRVAPRIGLRIAVTVMNALQLS